MNMVREKAEDAGVRFDDNNKNCRTDLIRIELKIKDILTREHGRK